jgi:hypothetical protein
MTGRRVGACLKPRLELQLREHKGAYCVKFDLTEAEYRELVRLAYLGEWIINAPHDPEHQDEAASLSFQRLLAQGKALTEIDRDLETSEYYLTSEVANRFYDDHISDYDDHVFWEELSERLAARDLATGRGVNPETIDRDEDLAVLKPLEDNYRKEFESYGVERMEIQDHLG